MAARKPLVLASGQVQQLQSTDTLDAPAIGGGEIVSQTNDESGAIVICTPVYNDANDGVKKAKADASATKDVLGLVRDTSITNAVAGAIQINGVLTATTTQWDAVFGTSGGLTKGTRYYVSAGSAGLATPTAPSAVGSYVCELGVAISTTELNINIRNPILL